MKRYELTRRERRAGKCKHCGLEKPDVKKRIDPFLYEVHEKKVEVIICNDCWDTRKGDI